jgi:hypothetical protein
VLGARKTVWTRPRHHSSSNLKTQMSRSTWTTSVSTWPRTWRWGWTPRFKAAGRPWSPRSSPWYSRTNRQYCMRRQDSEEWRNVAGATDRALGGAT